MNGRLALAPHRARRIVWLFWAWAAFVPAASASEAAWRALAEPGARLIVRHALAPGNGDPPEFVVEDCSTQRNLNSEGRSQARRLGAELVRRGIQVHRVFSSQWCRCLETARLLDAARVEPLPALNSFYEDRGAEPALMAALRGTLSTLDVNRRFVFVTHQVNITALTGVFPAAGEAIVFRWGGAGKVTVLGRIGPIE